MLRLPVCFAASTPTTASDPTEEDIVKISRLKNRPLKKLTPEDILVRHIIAIGEGPTTHKSIHPEGIVNGRECSCLSQICKKAPGIAMLDGHNKNMAPWGRVYDAQVVPDGSGKAAKFSFFFPNTVKGREIATEFDLGIRAEWSISYFLGSMHCSICHQDWFTSFRDAKKPRCQHNVGEKYDGVVCYWYPGIAKMAECSSVYAGAYEKTRNVNHADGRTENSDAQSILSKFWTGTYDGGEIGVDNFVEEGLGGGAPIGESGSATVDGACVDNSAETPLPEASADGKNPPTIDTSVSKLPSAGNDLSAAGSGAAGGGASDPASGLPQTGADLATDAQATGSAGGGQPATPEAIQPQAGNSVDGLPIIVGEPNTASGGNGVDASAGSETAESGGGSLGVGVSGKGEAETNLETAAVGEGAGAGLDAAAPEATTNEVSTPSVLPKQGEAAVAAAAALPGGETGATEPQAPTGAAAGATPASGESVGGPADSEAAAGASPGSPAPASEGSSGQGTPAVVAAAPSSTPILSLSDLVAALETEDLDSDERLTLFESLTPELRASYFNEYGATRECLGCGSHIGIFTVCCEVGYAALRPPKVGRFVGPMKPAKSGSVNNEFFDIGGFAKLPEGTYFVEPKYDGVYMEAHRKGGKISLLTEKSDHSEKFPGLVAELEKLGGGDFVLSGEIVKYRGRQRLGHEDVMAYLNLKDAKWEDYHFKFKPFDAVVWDGKNLSSESLATRREILDAVKRGNQVHPTTYTKVNHKVDATDVERAIRERQTREGAMVKSSEARYSEAGRKIMYKWKHQVELDVRVKEAHAKSGGGFTYTCEIGNGSDAQVIGETYATAKEAKAGDILQVSVDHVTLKDDKYTWYAPKVVSVREDKREADPLSVVSRIAERKTSAKKSHDVGGLRVDLGTVVSRLKGMGGLQGADLYICGGVVEHGFSEHDLDLYSTRELTAEERARIVEVLAEFGEYADFVYGEGAPVGPNILALAAGEAIDHAWKYAKKFVLQKHWWGKKEHFDLRFGAPSAPRMWGWTCFSEPTTEAGGRKARCQEKAYHDPKWMGFEGTMKPGEPGNPTKNLDAHMKILDKGAYEFVTRKKGFLEVILKGDTWKGRYVFREIDVKNAPSSDYVGDDEDKTKSGKIWVMWKAKDQTASGDVKKLASEYRGSSLMVWETELSEDFAAMESETV